MTPEQSRTVTTIAMLAGGAVLLGNVLDRIFPRETQPGGDVTPGPGPTNPDGTPQRANLTQAQANSVADGIEAALYGTGVVMSPTEDEAAVVDLMTVPLNDADVRLIMNAYGKRGTILAKYTLAAALASYLSASDRAEINQDYESKGIVIRF
jgi:hypothetical protein